MRIDFTFSLESSGSNGYHVPKLEKSDCTHTFITFFSDRLNDKQKDANLSLFYFGFPKREASLMRN